MSKNERSKKTFFSSLNKKLMAGSNKYKAFENTGFTNPNYNEENTNMEKEDKSTEVNEEPVKLENSSIEGNKNSTIQEDVTIRKPTLLELARQNGYKDNVA